MVVTTNNRRRSTVQIERHRIAGFVNHGQRRLADAACAAFHNQKLFSSCEHEMGGGFRAHHKGRPAGNFIARQREACTFAPACGFGHADTHHHFARGNAVEPVTVARLTQTYNGHAIGSGETAWCNMATQLLLNKRRLQHTKAEAALSFR